MRTEQDHSVCQAGVCLWSEVVRQVKHKGHAEEADLVACVKNQQEKQTSTNFNTQDKQGNIK